MKNNGHEHENETYANVIITYLMARRLRLTPVHFGLDRRTGTRPLLKTLAIGQCGSGCVH